MPWFSTKGQIGQFFFALISCIFAGIKAWPDMRANDLFSLGSILFYVLIGAVIFTLVLAQRQPVAGVQKGLIIYAAIYGYTSCYVDVTDTVRSHLKRGRSLDLHVTNSALGGDPAKHENKHLKVFYAFDGKPGVEVAPEDYTMVLPRKSR